MFDLRGFLMMGFRDSIGKIADYKVIKDAVGWMDKDVLEEKDLAELQNLIVKKNTPKPEPTEEPIIEEEPTEDGEPIEENAAGGKVENI